MELRREVLLTIGGLVVLNLLLAFGAISLFVRMGPAIERILQENVYSIVAAEEILAELADATGGVLSPKARKRVRDSFDRALQNVTEEDERPVLASLTVNLPPAMNGDHAARRRVVADLQLLISVNRQAMHRADNAARRLGSAGAWAAVLLGFVSFFFSLMLIVRLQRRIIRPLVALFDVVESAFRGERLRRCGSVAAPREIIQVMESVNRLLDERLRGFRP